MAKYFKISPLFFSLLSAKIQREDTEEPVGWHAVGLCTSIHLAAAQGSWKPTCSAPEASSNSEASTEICVARARLLKYSN